MKVLIHQSCIFLKNILHWNKNYLQFLPENLGTVKILMKLPKHSKQNTGFPGTGDSS
jgi:hypothetical protein